jgi:dihydrolipoamide dehydrogenase
MLSRQRSVVERLQKGIAFLFRKNGVAYVEGEARFSDPNTVVVTKRDGSVEELSAARFLLATGSRPAVLPLFQYDGETVITSNEALSLDAVPESLVVVGGGVVGCEFASIFAELGSKVTIIEMMPSILPMHDGEVSRQLTSYLKRRGITIHAKAKAAKVTKVPGGVTVSLEGGTEVTAAKMLVSIGRSVNTDSLGLGATGVATNQRGEILVDESMRTNIPHIYACGDATQGRFKLAHVASREGIVAVQNMRGNETRMSYRTIPSCVFTRPEAAGVGLTEEEAKLAGLVVRTGKALFLTSGKALAEGDSEGFVKVVVAENGRLLGMHIVGLHASDLIAEAAVAIESNLSACQLADVIHAHPTLAEVVQEAAEAALR